MGHDELTRYYVTAPGVPTATGRGLACTWTPSDTTSLTYRAAADLTSGGLEALYRRRSSIAEFEPTVVHSYPAVHLDTTSRRCTVDVAVADDTLLTITVDITSPTNTASSDACTEADRFAGSAVGYQGHRAP